MKNFDEVGHVLVKNFLSDDVVHLLSNYLENKIKRGEWCEEPLPGVGIEPTKYKYYADPFVEVLLADSLKKMEGLSGRSLFPTYSYVRVYQPGEVLIPHVDRESCEISATVNVANKGDISKIFARGYDGEALGYDLMPGDGVAYKGCEIEHFREPLKADQILVQIMLHYVDISGKYAKFKYDMRDDVGCSSFFS